MFLARIFAAALLLAAAAVPAFCHLPQGSAARLFDVVTMRGEGEDVQRWRSGCHSVEGSLLQVNVFANDQAMGSHFLKSR